MLTAATLIEEFLDSSVTQLVAKAVLKAQDVYEDSWNNNLIKYTLSHTDSAIEACIATGLELKWSKYIAHWNIFMWNDIQGWAESILNTVTTNLTGS